MTPRIVQEARVKWEPPRYHKDEGDDHDSYESSPRYHRDKREMAVVTGVALIGRITLPVRLR